MLCSSYQKTCKYKHSCNAPEHIGIAQGKIIHLFHITLKHTQTNERTQMPWSVSLVSAQLMVSTWFRKNNTIYVQLATEAVPRRWLPFKTWYPLLPAALHRPTTDPQPAAKRLHLPSPIYLTQAASSTKPKHVYHKDLRDRSELPSAHMSTCNIHNYIAVNAH